MTAGMGVDLLYLAWNRLEYTRASLIALRDNTDWSRVNRLWLYDDDSEDGTAEYVMEFAASMAPLACQFLRTKLRSPVAIMNNYLSNDCRAFWFAKIDNDTVVPPLWLNDCLRVLQENPSVDLLGIEAIYPPGEGPRTAEPTDHIGGIGLMRTGAFTELPVAAGRMGFSDWQIKHEVVKAWLNPGLPVILLDRLPFEPWASLGARYEKAGWQRPWQKYTEADADLWRWWRK